MKHLAIVVASFILCGRAAAQSKSGLPLIDCRAIESLERFLGSDALSPDVLAASIARCRRTAAVSVEKTMKTTKTAEPAPTQADLAAVAAVPNDAGAMFDGSKASGEAPVAAGADSKTAALAKADGEDGPSSIAPPPLPIYADPNAKREPVGLVKWWRDFDTKIRPYLGNLLFPPGPSREIKNKGRVEVVGEPGNSTTVLHVSGTPYEMGYEHGRLMKDEIKATYADLMKGTNDLLIGTAAPWLNGTWAGNLLTNKMLDVAYGRMAPHIPHDKLEEMQGLADGSGVPLRVIQRIHAVPEVSETSCSGLVATPSFTKNGHAYQLRILDYAVGMKLYKHPQVTVYHPNDGYAYASIGYTGFVGVISGMNEHGIGISEIGYGNPSGETLFGQPMPFVLSDVLRSARSVDGAEAVVRRAVGTNSYLFLFGDPQGGALAMHATSKGKITRRVNEAPEMTWNKTWKRDEGKPSVMPQLDDMVLGLHYEKKWKLFEGLRGKLTDEDLRRLSTDLAMKSNIQTVIYDLTSGEVWIANRTDDARASDRPFIYMNLKEAFASR